MPVKSKRYYHTPMANVNKIVYGSATRANVTWSMAMRGTKYNCGYEKESNMILLLPKYDQQPVHGLIHIKRSAIFHASKPTGLAKPQII